MTAPALSAAAAGLRFHRREYAGGLEAFVGISRPIYSAGELLGLITDTVTFRVVAAEHFDEAKGRSVRTGWRCLVLANGHVVFDDRGRECAKLAEAKAYLRRMADDPVIAHHVFLALCGEDFNKQSRLAHVSAMAAMDDFYGSAGRVR